MKKIKNLKNIKPDWVDIGQRAKRFSLDLLILLVACAIGAFSTVAILIPNGLSSGGITGIVRILQNYISFLDFSMMYYIGSLIILLICAILLGIKEARKIVLLTIMYPAVLFLFERLDFRLLEEKDIILAAIYCGVFSGICTGIVFSRGYSFGGTDTLAKIIKKKFLPHFALSKILMSIDAIVILTSGFLFGRNIALYALITTVIISKTIDFVMYGFDTKIVQIEVITDKPVELSSYIMHDLDRGVSTVTITGAYTKKERQKLVILCSPRESVLIRQKAGRLDKHAFVTAIHVDSVWGRGEGFGDIDKEEN